MLHTYDEDILKDELSRLPNARVLAFAVAAATVQARNYDSFAAAAKASSARRYREILGQLWAEANSENAERPDWEVVTAEVMSLLDESNEDNEAEWLRAALAEDALASLAYAIRYLLTSDPQDAVWSARRAYESADQVAIAKVDITPGKPDAEKAILSDVIVQRELARQKRALDLLQQVDNPDAVARLEVVSWTQSLLDDDELRSLPVWQDRG